MSYERYLADVRFGVWAAGYQAERVNQKWVRECYSAGVPLKECCNAAVLHARRDYEESRRWEEQMMYAVHAPHYRPMYT